jgi:hypothetical protein
MVVICCVLLFVAIKLIYIPLTARLNTSKERGKEQSGFKMRDLRMGVT